MNYKQKKVQFFYLNYINKIINNKCNIQIFVIVVENRYILDVKISDLPKLSITPRESV